MNYASKPTGDIGKAMTYKQEGIEKAQRSTQDSIRVSGSATDATAVVVGLIAAGKIGMLLKKHCKETEEKGYDAYEKTLTKEWLKWRKFFFDQRGINETFKQLTVPFED
jgi:hypothetical protein